MSAHVHGERIFLLNEYVRDTSTRSRKRKNDSDLVPLPIVLSLLVPRSAPHMWSEFKISEKCAMSVVHGEGILLTTDLPFTLHEIDGTMSL